ncbi:hypothetical protein Taci_1294 [Thermanaerovibrio acidaminovorans DSM 6589]|uniref:Uncharacterized protein n=1 Tax=Thermanaerovibrio acidaminovorans (strain ATCC 49978 / DSM 6589 / Su883) TaxID=525903 RepID=D1B684_THEAS|nr:hypothetical protein [Thermanaerovibrio acidaminovorans]ACZ19525.1 hypothetical protein Taci_1294 [Thermanaerovibrio acidaminovorans DSM 6589]
MAWCGLALGAPKALVEGVPRWLVPSVERTVLAVYREMGTSRPQGERLRILEMVCGRLFEGYRVEASADGDLLKVRLTPLNGRSWRVTAAAGSWREPVSSWIEKDLGDLSSELEPQLQGLPNEAFTWGRRALEELVQEVCSRRMRGFRAVVTPAEGVLNVSLTPGEPLVLALNPRVRSSTLPALVLGEMRDEALTGASAFLGLPVEYLRGRSSQAASHLCRSAESGSLAGRLEVEARAEVRPAPIGELLMELDSRRYVIWGWVAAHALSDGRSSEGGVHLGRKVQLLPSWWMEAYGEWVVDGVDLSVESRWGLKWRILQYLWAGVERTYPGGEWFLRVNTDVLPDDFYLHMAIGDRGGKRIGLGRRLSDHFSVEIRYDSRYDDPVSLMFLSNL